MTDDHDDVADGTGNRDHGDGDHEDGNHEDGNDEETDGHGHDDHGEDHDDHEHAHDHDHHHHDIETVGVGVVTVSSTRTVEDDPAGDTIIEVFQEEGHELAVRELVRDDLDGIQSTVDRLVEREDVDVVVTTGGTGVTPDDATIDAVRPVLRTELPGFGELFRRLSYEEIGTRIIGTRSLAGVARGVPVFCLPGSENAARLGTEEIIVPEVPHLAGLARRDQEQEADGAAEEEASDEETAE